MSSRRTTRTAFVCTWFAVGLWAADGRATLAPPHGSHTDCLGQTVAYRLADPANAYATVGGSAVQYGAAGNLTVDENGRRYSYDERNRLIEVRKPAPDNTILASYAYDALGRRIVATIGAVTTRYYYDGQNVIEEYGWSGSAESGRLRYHVNGAQYIDERVATFEDGSGAFTYYLLKENFSVAGTGNADGSEIKRLDYTAEGDFGGSTVCPTDFDHDGDVDVADFGVFHGCFNGPNRPAASPRCYQSTPPSSGTFALHGRPVDVLPDGHTLLFVRARFYDLKHGRWLQRDPTGFADGGNLYEAFGNNALRFSDPTGTEIWATARRYKTEVDGVPVWAVDYHINRNGIDLGIGGLVYPNAVDRRHFRTEYYPFTEDLRTIARYDTMIESGRQIYEELAILGEEIAAYEKAIRVSATAAVGLPVAAVAAPAASAAFSTTAVGITTTTLGGNVAAASLTGAVSLGSGSAVAEGLVGGDARQIALAGLQGAAIGGVTGGILGTALPTGTFSAVTTEGQAVVVTAIRTGPTPGAGSTQPRLIHPERPMAATKAFLSKSCSKSGVLT